MKKGSYLQADEIGVITSHVGPQEFVSILLNYDAASSAKRGGFIERLASVSTIKPERVKQLADFLVEQSYEEILALQHKAIPTDRPEIRVQVAEGAYEPLAAVSTGQKCTALLVMALADSSAPVVVTNQKTPWT